jgi:hypothetical protein
MASMITVYGGKRHDLSGIPIRMGERGVIFLSCHRLGMGASLLNPPWVWFSYGLRASFIFLEFLVSHHATSYCRRHGGIIGYLSVCFFNMPSGPIGALVEGHFISSEVPRRFCGVLPYVDSSSPPSSPFHCYKAYFRMHPFTPVVIRLNFSFVRILYRHIYNADRGFLDVMSMCLLTSQWVYFALELDDSHMT